MKSDAHSVRGKQRGNVLQAYRARGHNKNDLSLLYSVKTGRDWIVKSDRRLVHWIYFLETNSDVQCFDLAPPETCTVEGEEVSGLHLAATVQYFDGRHEWHGICSPPEARGRDCIALPNPNIELNSNAATSAGATYRNFEDDELKACANEAVHWLKPLAMASTLRTGKYIHEIAVVATCLSTRARGTLREVLGELSDFDPAIVMGLLVKMRIQGLVCFDLKEQSFGYDTQWKWTGHT